MSQKYRPEMRIRRAPDYDRILDKGKQCRCKYFGLYVLYGTGTQVRIGVIASRKLGNAIKRNRAKRLIRETFRRNRLKIPAGVEMVVVVHRPMVGSEQKEIEKAFLGALELGLR